MARGGVKGERGSGAAGQRDGGSQGKSLTLMLDEARGLHSGD